MGLKNPGVETRIQRDSVVRKSETENIEAKSYSILEKKAKLYDKLSSLTSQESGETTQISADRFLVDFDRKKIEEIRDDDDFDSQKKRFYDMLKQQKKGGFGSFIGDEDLQQKLDQQERERLHWEREAISNMDQEIDELDSLKKRYNVMQSYDKKLTKEEKEMLKEVIAEQQEEKEERAEVLTMNQQRQKARQEKLKNLKLS